MSTLNEIYAEAAKDVANETMRQLAQQFREKRDRLILDAAMAFADRPLSDETLKKALTSSIDSNGTLVFYYNGASFIRFFAIRAESKDYKIVAEQDYQLLF